MMVEEGGYVGPPMRYQWPGLLLEFATANAPTEAARAAIRLGAQVRVRLLPRKGSKWQLVKTWRIVLELPGCKRRQWMGVTSEHERDTLAAAVADLGWELVP